MSLKVSVFLPVYKSSDLLENLLEELANDSYEDKEIFVTIDEPDAESRELAKKCGKKANFTLNEQRGGKVDALNSAVEGSNGEILIFLDADITLGGSKEFLATIVKEMDGVDILDVKKKIARDSFISRMVNYEYVSSNFGNYLCSRLIKRCFGVNGAAFAIRRGVFEEVGGFSKVVSEDLDIAVKTLLKNKQFKYTDKVEVCTRAPSSWRSWRTQRKRWGIGAGLWIKVHWRNLTKYMAKYPQVTIPSLIILFPTVIPLVLNYVFVNLSHEILYFAFMLLATRFSFLIPFLFSVPLAPVLFTSLVNFLISFAIFSVLYYSVSRKLRMHFNFLEFLVYYFLYQPLAFFTMIVGILTPFFSSKYKMDWKV